MYFKRKKSNDTEKKSKYKNTKTEFNGIVFDSKKEVKRYKELLLLLESGDIKELDYHKIFILQSSFRDYKNYLERQITYEADFYYYDCEINKYVIEDVKSSYTKKLSTYIIKRKLTKFKYPEIIFKEII